MFAKICRSIYLCRGFSAVVTGTDCFLIEEVRDVGGLQLDFNLLSNLSSFDYKLSRVTSYPGAAVVDIR